MRTIKQTMIKIGFFLFTLMLCNQGVAKETQIGYYDSLAVMNDSLIWSNARGTVETWQKEKESAIANLEKNIKTEEEKYISSKDSMSETERNEFEAKLGERKQNLESKKLQFAMDLEIMQERLYGPIKSSIKLAISHLISKHKLSKLVAKERLADTEKPNALNLTQELIVEVIRIEKIRISGK